MTLSYISFLVYFFVVSAAFVVSVEAAVVEAAVVVSTVFIKSP